MSSPDVGDVVVEIEASGNKIGAIARRITAVEGDDLRFKTVKDGAGSSRDSTSNYYEKAVKVSGKDYALLPLGLVNDTDGIDAELDGLADLDSILIGDTVYFARDHEFERCLHENTEIVETSAGLGASIWKIRGEASKADGLVYCPDCDAVLSRLH